MESNALYLHALLTIHGLSQNKLRRSLENFPDACSLWNAENSLLHTSGLSKRIITEIEKLKRTYDFTSAKNFLSQHTVEIISCYDGMYPAYLREIPDFPLLLYTRGTISVLSEPCVSIVGSRKMTDYGRRVASVLACELSKNGVTVVSGLALGIDSVCHRATLDANGKTVAVLGSGVDDQTLTPRSHVHLAQEIITSGALISEYPPLYPASKITFPARNRIIAALSLATIVVEATERSGSLITPRLALEYNRTVFAVPGSIFSENSRGTHQLITSGATLCTSATDIISELNITARRKSSTLRKAIPTSPDEECILRFLALQENPVSVDKIIQVTKLNATTVLSVLSILEMTQRIKHYGGLYSLC